MLIIEEAFAKAVHDIARNREARKKGGILLKINDGTLTRDNSNNSGLNKKRTRALHLILSFLCTIIFFNSWISNFGWFRLLFVLPMLIHAVIFCFANIYYSKYNYAAKKMRFVNYFVYITYLLLYILLPDLADDTGAIIAVFGLIKNRKLIDIMWDASWYLFPANIILIIWQIVYTAKDRHKTKRLKRERGRGA